MYNGTASSVYLVPAYGCVCKHTMLSIKDQVKTVPMEKDFCAADTHSNYFILIGFYTTQRNVRKWVKV